MSPKPVSSSALAIMLMLLAPASAENECAPELKAEAAGLIQNYAGKLKAALRAAMQARGPEGALEVCNKQAPAIAAEVSRGSGWSVARTSLKPRNAASAPDAYERKIMEGFNARIAKGRRWPTSSARKWSKAMAPRHSVSSRRSRLAKFA